MAFDAEILRRLSQVDMPAPALREVLSIFADVLAADGARKAKDRERKRDKRMSAENPRTIRGHSTEIPEDNPSPKEIPPTPPKEITPTQTLTSFGVRSAREEAFDRFWAAYPAKIGKDAARKAFNRVGDQKRATLGQLLSGIERYRQTKPSDREYCNPATWLNQGRWQDEPASIEPRVSGASAGPIPRHERGNPAVEARQRILAAGGDLF